MIAARWSIGLVAALVLGVVGAAAPTAPPAPKGLTPAEQEALLKEAETLLAEDRAGTALERIAGRAAEFDGAHRTAYFALRARLYYAAGRPQDSRADRALGEGRALMGSGQHVEAAAAFERGLLARPNDPYLLNGRGLARRALDELDGALADFDAARKIDPDLPASYVNRADLLASLLGEEEYAKKYIAEVMARFPGSWEVQAYLAGSAMKIPDYALAEQAATRWVGIEPAAARAYGARALARRFGGNLDGALADTTRAVELEPSRAELWHLRGEVFVDKRQPERAIQDYTKAIELRPAEPQYLYHRARQLFFGGSYENAAADCAAAVGLDPAFDLAWDTRAWSLVKLGRQDEAAQTFDAFVAARPESWRSWYARGTWRMTREEYDACVEDLAQAEKLDAVEANAFHHLGLCRLQKNENEEAARVLARAIEIDPRSVESWTLRCRARINLQQWNDALADCDQALALAQAPEVEGYRAVILWKLGRITEEEAEQALDKARRDAAAFSILAD